MAMSPIACVAWMGITGARRNGAQYILAITGMSVIVTMGKPPLSFGRTGRKSIRTISTRFPPRTEVSIYKNSSTLRICSRP